MIFTRAILEENEARTLAPYAIKSRDSRGREYPEDEAGYRTAFQRDRDRILHTTAFRRLEYKTQVFVNTEGDYYRTRLTHTLEVAQEGRTIARALGANEDLVEAICLAHDLGHPAFGHAGERALGRLMAPYGGFDHNEQSLRIVTALEHRYPDWPGLNLTYELREGIVKHETEYDIRTASGYEPEKRGALEAQICNIADETAYNAHDLDDGLRAGLFGPSDIEGLELWQDTRRSIGWTDESYGDLIRYRMIRRLLGILITDAIQCTNENIEAAGATCAEEIQLLDHTVVGHSTAMLPKVRQLKDFLYERMYRHYRLVRMQMKAERMIEELFVAYVSEPDMLPESPRERWQRSGDSLQRVVCDYIAGMTDRYALEEHRRLFNPTVRV